MARRTLKEQRQAKRLGKSLADRRIYLGLTQAFVAGQLDICIPTLIAIEKGTVDISIGLLKNICDIYSLPIGRIL